MGKKNSKKNTKATPPRAAKKTPAATPDEVRVTEDHRRALAVAVADFTWLLALPRTIEDAACHIAHLCDAHGKPTPEGDEMATRARRVLEVVAAHRGVKRPEDLTTEALQYELTSDLAPELDRRRHLAAALAHHCGLQIESWDARELWDDLDLPPFEEGYTEQAVNAYRWRPVWDPLAPFFDGRIEVQPIYVNSIAEHGVIAPVHIFRRGDEPGHRAYEPSSEDVVVIDGIQRMTSVLAFNRRLLTEWSNVAFATAPPDFLIMVPARYFEGKSDKRWKAFMGLNEQRLLQDPITKAQKIDAAVREADLHILDIAAAMQIEERMVRHYAALLKLSPAMARKVQRGEVGFPLARVLCQIEDHELQAKALFSLRCLPGGKGPKWLKDAITIDELKAAIAEGASIVENESAADGTITRCPESGKMFRVTADSPRRGGKVFASEEDCPRANLPAKRYEQRLEQLHERLGRAGELGMDRQGADLLRAALAFLKDGKVDPQFALFTGEVQTTRRRQREGLLSNEVQAIRAAEEADAAEAEATP